MAGNERLTRGFLRISAWLGLTGPEERVRVAGILQPTIPFEMFACESVHINGVQEVGADGQFSVVEVPTGEIWHCSWAQVTINAPGDFVVDNVIFLSRAGDQILWDGGDVSSGPSIIQGLHETSQWFYPLDRIGVNIKTHSVTGNVQIDLRVRRWRMDTL